MSNPVPSDKISDGKLNFGTADVMVNSDDHTVTTRTGKVIRTFAGINAEASSVINEIETQGNAAVLSTGWFIVGEFETGFEFTARNQVGVDTNGNTWSYNGSLPFTVPPATVPSEPDYTNRGDAALRSELETDLGAAIIKNNVIAVDGLKGLAAIPAGLRRADLRYESDGFYVGSTVGGRSWKWKSSEPKSNHNGGSIVDPERVEAWDGTPEDLETLFQATGESELGCFVATNAEDNLHHFGFNKELSESYLAISQAIDSLHPESKAIYDNNFNLIPFTASGGIDLSQPSDQIAPGARRSVSNGDTVYAISKGSYTLNDNSFLTTMKVFDNKIVELDRIDLGVGANVRDIFLIKGYLYVIAPATTGLRIYSITESGLPVFLRSQTGIVGGGIAFSKVVGDRVIISGWTNSWIRVLAQRPNGNLDVVQEVVTDENSNAGITELGDGSYVVFKHAEVGSPTLGRFWFDNGKIKNLQFYSIPGVGFLRRGTCYNGCVWTRSYADIGKGLLKIMFHVETGEPFIEKEFDIPFLGAQLDSRIDKFLVGGNWFFDLEYEIPYELSETESFKGFNAITQSGDYFVTTIDWGDPSGSAAPNDGGQNLKASFLRLRSAAKQNKTTENLNYPTAEVTATGFRGLIWPSGRIEAEAIINLGSAQSFSFPSVYNVSISSLGISEVTGVSVNTSLNTATASDGNTSINCQLGIVSSSNVGVLLSRNNTSFLSNVTLRLHIKLSGYL